jgi:purine-binding chemotaxis protein CheW
MTAAHVQVVIGSEHYVVDVSVVREVAEIGDVVPVPGAPQHIAGLQNLRGELVAVIRPYGLLGLGAGSPRRVVVIEHAGRRAGLAVDAARDVTEISRTQDIGEAFTREAVLHDGELIGVLDVPALLEAVSAPG